MRELRELFERQADYVLEQSEDRVLINLPRFVRFATEEPRVAAIVAEVEEEYARAVAAYSDRCGELASDLGAVLEANKWVLQAMRSDAPPYTDEVEPLGGLIPILLKGAREVTLPDIWEPVSPTIHDRAPSTVAEVLVRAEEAVHVAGNKDLANEEGRSVVLQAVKDLQARHEHALWKLVVEGRASAGAAWRRLRKTTDGVIPLNPQREDAGTTTAENVTAGLVHEYVSHVAVGVEPPQKVWAGVKSRTELIDVVRRDLRAFKEEVSHRIGLRLSHLALVRRFKARCQKHDALELREAAERARKTKKKPEDVLSRAAARYLFDQGLDPIFNAEIVSLRPDLFDVTTRAPLYVEAKWYDAKKMPWSRLKSAPWQVWSTWNDLAGAHDVREAFLLIFRLGGPLVTVPDVVRHRGVSLYPMVIDIGPNTPPKGDKAGRGSKAGEQTKDLVDSAFLPTDAQEDD